jgi:hypothetical protein
MNGGLKTMADEEQKNGTNQNDFLTGLWPIENMIDPLIRIRSDCPDLFRIGIRSKKSSAKNPVVTKSSNHLNMMVSRGWRIPFYILDPG